MIISSMVEATLDEESPWRPTLEFNISTSLVATSLVSPTSQPSPAPPPSPPSTWARWLSPRPRAQPSLARVTPATPSQWRPWLPSRGCRPGRRGSTSTLVAATRLTGWLGGPAGAASWAPWRVSLLLRDLRSASAPPCHPMVILTVILTVVILTVMYLLKLSELVL